MSRSKLFLFFCLCSLLLAKPADTNLSKELKYLSTVYDNAVRDFRFGSYYDALDEFAYLAKFPNTPYYLSSLFMLANTYLYIGKRTGDKKYFWAAQNYLNLYLAKGGKKSADYYYLKANIFENLGFYERALANYTIALSKAQEKPQKLKIVMGLLRSSVWLHKIDMATRYLLILSIESLGKNQKKEFQFLQGMYHFAKKEYEKALKYFKKTYRNYESFLIDNPQYYYLVAETAYRLGDLRFAEQLFRRILSYVKNKDVLQKSLLRIGDIKFLQQRYKPAAASYIRLVTTYPKSRYATVAKLKLLYLIHTDKKLRYYIKKYMPKADFLQDPQKFVVTTLVKNRTNYIGLFALANFGMEAFDLSSDKLFKRLGWELSLVSPSKLKYEHIEYFRRLWAPYLKKEGERVCDLYESNPPFFLKVFAKDDLLHVANALKKCEKGTLYLGLLRHLAKKYQKSDLWLRYARALYEAKRYKEAMEALQRSGRKGCDYYKLQASICFVGELACSKDTYSKVRTACDGRDLYAHIFGILSSSDPTYATKFLERDWKILAKEYEKDPVVRKFVQLLAKRLIQKERYADVVRLLGPLAKQIQKDCFLNGVLSLSYIRIGKMKYAQELLERSGECEDGWYLLAKNALEDAKLMRKLKGM